MIEQVIEQPIVVALGVPGNVTQTFVVIEGEVVETRCLVSAVDKCFKLHYIGQIECDPIVNHVWNFIQTHLYGIVDNVPVSKCVHDLISFLKAR